MIQDTADILGYYTESRAVAPGRSDSLADIAKSILESPQATRWPVWNREERTPIESVKRAIIHQRDGYACRYCDAEGAMLTVDHIIPRTAFRPEHLRIADRSDNLVSACWDCNQRKSNFESLAYKRPGVVVRCWECMNPGHEELERADRPDLEFLVFCGGCGYNHVPSVSGWVL